jgi:hypothetical protein
MNSFTISSTSASTNFSLWDLLTGNSPPFRKILRSLLSIITISASSNKLTADFFSKNKCKCSKESKIGITRLLQLKGFKIREKPKREELLQYLM